MSGGEKGSTSEAAYLRSQQRGRLSPLRSTIVDPANLEAAELPCQLPRIVPFRAWLNHAGRLQLRYPVSSTSIPRLPENLPHLCDALAQELHAIACRLRHTYQYGYGLACLNTPCPIFTIFEGDRLATFRRWFDQQPHDTFATYTWPAVELARRRVVQHGSDRPAAA